MYVKSNPIQTEKKTYSPN